MPSNSRKSCFYSNIGSYGTHGAASQTIIAPTPVAAVPSILNILGSGHSFAQPSKHHNSKKIAPLPNKCTSYLKMDQVCENQFNQMFSKIH